MYILNGFLTGLAAAVFIAAITESPEFIFVYVSMYVRLMLLAGSLIVFMFSIWFLFTIIRNKDVYDRNHEATILLKKSRRGTLTEEERRRFEQYQTNGILSYNSFGVLRVSDQACDELWG
tara:strand:+ start:2126 stop:2485 length:360 start_codon:yes stop_codon:yes gene_type:complete